MRSAERGDLPDSRVTSEHRHLPEDPDPSGPRPPPEDRSPSEGRELPEARHVPNPFGVSCKRCHTDARDPYFVQNLAKRKARVRHAVKQGK